MPAFSFFEMLNSCIYEQVKYMNNSEKQTKTGKKLKEWLVAAGAIFLLYVFFFVSGIGCPIKFLTGVSCMGCGMTRAWRQLLRLHFKRAFAYHPLVLLPIPAVFVLFFREKIPSKWYKVLVYLMIAAFVAVYVIRMASQGQSVVVFAPKEGFLYRCFRYFVRHCIHCH